MVIIMKKHRFYFSLFIAFLFILALFSLPGCGATAFQEGDNVYLYSQQNEENPDSHYVLEQESSPEDDESFNDNTIDEVFIRFHHGLYYNQQEDAYYILQEDEALFKLQEDEAFFITTLMYNHEKKVQSSPADNACTISFQVGRDITDFLYTTEDDLDSFGTLSGHVGKNFVEVNLNDDEVVRLQSIISEYKERLVFLPARDGEKRSS